MRADTPGGLLAASLLLAACGGDTAVEAPRDMGDAAADPAAAATPGEPSPAATDPVAPGWDLVASGEGAALIYPASGPGTSSAAIRLYCPADANRLLVNVPAFRPVGSEERMTFGSGGQAHTLVADTRGDRQRGGVSGTGPVPNNLGALIGGPISVNYGAQNSGPHPAPPRALASGFLAGCGFPPPPSPPPPPTPAPTNVSACLIQGEQRLTNPALRALGTEPFWAARIEGRCVTYSHPEDQQGTRVWTRYTPGAGGGGTWTGALEDKPFVLTARPQAGCSDGMSDNRYPLAVDLTVGGEQRRGCAERR
jgi:uncharacterized membrane protein